MATKRTRTYRVYGKTFDISGDASGSILNDYMVRLAAEVLPEVAGKSVKATAGILNTRMKRGIRTLSKSTTALGYVQRSRWYDRASSGISGLKEKTAPGQDYGAGGKGLLKAIGYKYFPSKTAAVIGWLSESAVKYAEKFQSGTVRTVTPSEALIYARAQKLARAAGDRGYKYRPVAGTVVRVPARPVIAPFLQSQGRNIAGLLADKFAEQLGVIEKDEFEERLTIRTKGFTKGGATTLDDVSFPASAIEAMVAITSNSFKRAF